MKTSIVITFIVFFLIYFLLDFYTFKSTKSLLEKKKSIANKLLFWFNLSLTGFGIVSIIISIFLRNELVPSYVNFVMFAFISNFLFKLILFPFLLLDDLVRALKKLILLFSRKQENKDSLKNGHKISRNEFIVKTGAVVASLPLAGFSFGIISGAHDYQIRRKSIYIPNLPKAFDGMKIGQLSDIHSGSFFNKVAVEGGVEMLLNEKPDLIAFTGDLVNEDASEMKEYVKIFSKVKSDLGVKAILGNHDYGMRNMSSETIKKNRKKVSRVHQELGWDLMLNRNEIITVNNESFGLIGVENWGNGFIQEGDLRKAYFGMEEMPAKILLSHDPSHFTEVVTKDFKDIDLTLSGHTHGMQFGIETPTFKWSPVQYRYPYWAGLYDQDGQRIYVNRGFGYIGYPGRLGILPEITILELKSGFQA